jgi:hypothetical protein
MRVFQEIPFGRVTIVPDADCLGAVVGYRYGLKFIQRCEMGYDFTPRDRDRLEREIMSLLAGHAAERRFAGRANHAGSYRDRKTAIDLASTFVDYDPKVTIAFFRWISLRVDAVFESPHQWLFVKAVAAALLERQRLTYREVRATIEAAIDADIDPRRHV